MRKKVFKGIVATSIGLAMAVGSGVGIVSNYQKANPVYATECTSILSTGSNDSENKTNTWTNSYLTIVQSRGTTPSGKTQTDPSASYLSAPRWYAYNVVTFTPGSGYSIDSVVVTANTENYANALQSSAYSNATAAVSNTTVTITPTVGTSVFSITMGGQCRLNALTFNYSTTSSATVASVEVTGSMSVTSYNTVQSWSSTGLEATGTMSDSTSYTGEFEWSFSPVSPVAAVLANSGNEVTNLSVTATATAEEESGSKATSGINVSYATVTQLAAVTPASGTLEGVIAKGIVSQVDSFNETYHSITYWISVDGTNTNQYEVYGGKNVGDTDFSAIGDVHVGDYVVVYGNVKTYNAVKEFDKDNYLLNLTRPEVDEVVASIKDGTYYAGTTLESSDFDVLIGWTGEKEDEIITDGFTWVIGDGSSDVLSAGNNSVKVIYQGVESDPFNVVGEAASTRDIIERTITTNTELSYHYSKTDKTVSNTLNKAFTGRTGTSYGNWTNAATYGISYSGNSAAGNDAIQLRSTNSSSIITTANTNNREAKRIVVEWNSNTAADRTIDIYGKNEVYSASGDLYNSSKGTLLGSIIKGTSATLEIDGAYKFIGIRSHDGALYLDSINIEWSDGFNYSFSNISIRFGGLISKTLWNELDTNEHNISGFGVMIASGDALNADEYIKDNLGSAVLYDAEPAPSIDNGDIVDYYKSKTQMATPVESGDNYIWNLFQRVDTADIDKVFVAVSYIKVGDEYVFMRQVRYSVKSLASDYIDNRGCTDGTAGGSLSILAN